MSIILLWQILGFSMQFPLTGSSDPSMSINFHHWDQPIRASLNLNLYVAEPFSVDATGRELGE